MDNIVLYAFLNVDQPRIGQPKNRPSEYWKVLFQFYNSNLPDGGRRLAMSCQPCFVWVWQFCRKKISEQVLAKIRAEQVVENEMKIDEFRSQNIV
jgi:hypothetical protein